MTGKALAIAAGLVLAGSIPACSPVPAARQALIRGTLAGSNVLLVTIDTLRRDRIGAYGHRGGLTPNLDALASAGVRFTHAFSHAPLTLPSHASILTGLTPMRHGIRTNGSSRLADHVPTLATVLKASGYRSGAFVGAFVLDARYGLSRGFDVYDDHYARSERPAFSFAERRAAEVVQPAAEWILAAGDSRPWFAWLHLFDPHAPYDAPAEFRGGRSPYDAEVAYTDATIGRLLDRLRAAGALARTLIVVTADHGESLGDHGESTHGLFAYDATVAVPLVLSGTGVGAAAIDAAAGHADVLPTICDLLALEPPSGLDGTSLAAPVGAERVVYFEALDAALTRGWAPLTGIASARWKFIDLPGPELYDLASDPTEAHNLAGQDPSRLQLLARAREALVARAGGAAPGSAPAALDDEAARRLRSLGYVTAAVPRASGDQPDRFTAADDPKQLVGLNERFHSALSAFDTGRTDDALAGFLSVLEERPDFLTARTSAATVLLAGRHPREAVALLRQAPSHQASAPELLAKLGVTLREAGDLAAAAQALERARAAGAQNPELANDLGVVYARLGRANDARALFSELLARDPDDATTWNNLGALELSSRRPGEAAAAFRQAVAADPARGDAWQGLGAALVEHDRPAAIDAWRRAERLLPNDYDLLFNLAMVLAEGPAPREALPYLERFERDAPRERYAGDIAQVRATIRRVRG